VVNRAEQVAVALAAAARVVGVDKVTDNLRPTTGGEDFSEMMQVCPGAFMRIGNGVAADGSFKGLHTPGYDFNDAIIPEGIAYWVSVVGEELGAPRD
jgi:hippurate hydrolase